MESPLCVHCGGYRVNRPRGLCHRCFASEARFLYPCKANTGRKEHGVKLWVPGMRAEKCRHCDRIATRPRGLCWNCYNDVEIRMMHESESKFHPYAGDEQDFYGGHALPSCSTLALPGSSEKIDVLRGRGEARVALWHPGDAVLDAEGVLSILGHFRAFLED